MKVNLLFFGRPRERLGQDREAAEIPGDAVTVASMLAYLRARGGDWTEALAEQRGVRCAVNQTLSGLDAPLHEGDEVAIFSPISGG